MARIVCSGIPHFFDARFSGTDHSSLSISNKQASDLLLGDRLEQLMKNRERNNNIKKRILRCRSNPTNT